MEGIKKSRIYSLAMAEILREIEHEREHMENGSRIASMKIEKLYREYDEIKAMGMIAEYDETHNC